MTDASNSVEALERRLIAAMLASDVGALDSLIDDRVVFTDPAGNVLTKSMDLAAHREGLLKLSKFDLSSLAFHQIDELVVSTSQAELVGTYVGTSFAGRFAYTRVWACTGSGWRVVAGQASQLA
ncbi:MAG: nuclear transport factor 2 family protein [Novosphingobium sp.]